MNTVLLYITIAFFAVVVITVLVMIIGGSSARGSAEAELERADTAPVPQYRRT